MPKYAIDCEMVGSGNKSLLARVSIVKENGQVVLDTFVKPTGLVTDYRDFVSGIKKRDLDNGSDFNSVRALVANILHGNIIIGHSLDFDLEALDISIPQRSRRDLAEYSPLMINNQPVALKTLAKNYLGRAIQSSEHDSVEDARACMDLYQKFSNDWDLRQHLLVETK